MEKISIVFFVSSLDSGGIENYLLRFLQHSHHGFERVFVYCKSGRGGQLENDYLNLSNVVVIKRKHSYLNFLSFISMYRFLKKNKINAVCDFTGNFAGLPVTVAAFANVKKRVAFYRSAGDDFQPTLLKKLYDFIINKLTFKFSTAILSNSEAAFDYFYKIDWRNNEQFRVIYNGLNADKFNQTTGNLRAELKIPHDAFVIGHTGRYNPAKNHKTIMEVAFRLVRKHSDIYFLLCGNGVKTNLKDLVLSEGVDKQILLFENRTDIPVFLNTLDCYFFPSTREGQPNALIEALVVGLPFVASNIATIKETIGLNTNLYPANGVDEFVNALEKIYLKRPGRDIVLQKTIIDRFDHKKRFDEFYDVLI